LSIISIKEHKYIFTYANGSRTSLESWQLLNCTEIYIFIHTEDSITSDNRSIQFEISQIMSVKSMSRRAYYTQI